MMTIAHTRLYSQAVAAATNELHSAETALARGEDRESLTRHLREAIRHCGDALDVLRADEIFNG